MHLYWTKNSRGGISMRYSYEFKRKCVDMYRKGIWPETPNGVSKEIFQKTVRKWVRIEDNCGSNALQHKTQNKVWSAEERYELVAQVLAQLRHYRSGLQIYLNLLFHGGNATCHRF